jgi:hypothetical protein
VETILLPLAFGPDAELRGAYGTLWRGEVWVHNRSSQSVATVTTLGCPVLGCTFEYPGGYLGLLREPLDSIPDRGILLTPSLGSAPALSFSNRIFETTRHAQPQGIELPVVREEQFLTGTSLLLGIPAGPGVRSALRVYDPRPLAGVITVGRAVKVELLDTRGNVVGTTTLTTTFTLGLNPADPLRPGFAAILDLASAFPAVNGLDHFHMRLTPLTQGGEYWAMVSVTDNDTQQVLLITPQ